MRKTILTVLTIFMSLFFIVSCGDDDDTSTDVTGTANITINGVKFTESVACSTSIYNGKLTLSVSAIDNAGNSIGIASVISGEDDNYEFTTGDTFDVNYIEAGKSYSASTTDGGTFSATFDGKLIKASFDVDAKVIASEETKNLKGEIECTPGGATN